MALKGKIEQFGINDFVAKISKHKIASPNRYYVEFSFPRGINVEGAGANADRLQFINQNVRVGAAQSIETTLNSGGDLSVMCTASQMPSRALMTNEHKHTNYPIKIPYAQGYDTVTFGFTLSENLKERRFFELWQETVVNVRDGSMNFYDEYVSDIFVHQLDKESNIKYTVRLIEAYPISISNVDHSYASQNDILSMSVTFAYKYWQNENKHIMET